MVCDDATTGNVMGTKLGKYDRLLGLLTVYSQFVVGLCLSCGPVFAQGTATVKISPAVRDIAAQVNKAISTLPNGARTVELPAGSYTQSKTIYLSGEGIHLVGSGTVLTYNPKTEQIIDSGNSTVGWQGPGVDVGLLSSIGEDHPDPAQGEAYIEAATGTTPVSQVQKSIPKTDFTSGSKIGVWVTLNLTAAPQRQIQFFVSDGSRTAYWTLVPNNNYGQWRFFGLDRANPTGNDGTVPDMAAITVIGFRNLASMTKYYFDAITVYTPTGPSVSFTSCHGCSLENVTIQWEPAADRDAVIAISSDTSHLVLDNIHTVGGAFGFDFTGTNSANTCRHCLAEHASRSGFELRGSSTSDQLINVQANYDLIGIHVGGGVSNNSIVSPRCYRTNNVGILIEGSRNEVQNAELDTWMTFGLTVMGGSHNSIIGVKARSSVGESAIQFFSGAADNILSSISVEQSGANGLDFGGGGRPMLRNTVSGLIVHHSGSSAWHGGTGGSLEGRSLCICGANENSFSHIRIYDTGQAGSLASGVEGIIITNGSSNNLVEDAVISNARDEGIIVWGDGGNTLRNVRLLGNGLQSGRAGIRIAGGARNTVLDGICYWKNGGGGIKNQNNSSLIRNAREVKGLNPEMNCP